MSRSCIALALTLAAALTLGACAHHPALGDADVPQGFAGISAPNAQAWPAQDFWARFSAPELVSLLAQAEQNNTDLAAAAARVAQARAALGIASAALFPAIDVGAGGSEQGTKGSASGAVASTDKFTSRKSFDVSAGASYELDFWGRNRSIRRVAKAALEASRFDRETVALTITANIAADYLSLLSLRDRLGIARANLDNAERVRDIVLSRVRNGAASPLDLAQQDAVLAAQRAAIPALEQDERFARNALAVLLGRPPEGFDVMGRSLAGISIPHLAAGLPSDLLLRRPDLRSAEVALRGADANIDAARAAFFPSIDLTVSGGLQSAALSSLFGGAGAFYTVASALTQPIFEGGALVGQLKQAEARRAELVANYRGAVFAAFGDVENALGDIASRTAQLRERSAQADASARAFKIAEAQYREGATDFLAVLDAQRTLYDAQDALAQSKLAVFQAEVTLFRVLGGGWPANTLISRK